MSDCSDNDLIECKNTCWCLYCEKKIRKGDKMVLIFRSARSGFTRTNICLICIEKLYKKILKKDLHKIKKVRLLEALNEK